VISCVDLFCGVGGLTAGLRGRGVKMAAGFDLDPACRFPYETNNRVPFVEMDVRDLSSESLSSYWKRGAYSLLAGCAPCQPFSTYSQTGRRKRSDDKWDLVNEFARLIRECQPDLVTMENVPQLERHRVYKQFVNALSGYHVWSSIVDCVEYGVPQTRKRLVLLASKLGPISLPQPQTSGERQPTVREAISHLTTLRSGQSSRKDRLHRACSLSELNLERIRVSKPGGTWRDWDKKLLSPCHRKESGETYPSVYGRMEWDKPSPTITTQCFGYGNGRFGHPSQHRAITLREAAILQTFPEDYEFVEPGEKVCFSVLGRLIGNAVPVRLGEVIADAIKVNVRGHRK